MACPELFIKVFNDPIFAENGLVLSLGDGRPCWIVDPGLPPQAANILAYVAAKSLTPEAIVLTHAHGDHIAGIDEVREQFAELPIYLARQEWPLLTDAMQNLSGIHGASITACDDHKRDMAHGDMLTLDGTTWKVLDVSGHSPAGRAVYCAEIGIALVGDAVFAGSIGRTDFPHSDHDRLIRNIHENILTLPDETMLIPGHGPSTTVAVERATNPFLR